MRIRLILIATALLLLTGCNKEEEINPVTTTEETDSITSNASFITSTDGSFKITLNIQSTSLIAGTAKIDFYKAEESDNILGRVKASGTQTSKYETSCDRGTIAATSVEYNCATKIVEGETNISEYKETNGKQASITVEADSPYELRLVTTDQDTKVIGNLTFENGLQ